MHIAIGFDHKGVIMKNLVARTLSESGHSYQDFGCYNTDSVDYPDVAAAVGRSVTRGESQMGILVCNTGIGMSIAANKVKGIRAAHCCNTFQAKRSREHNDANILCLGSEMEPALIQEMIITFLTENFEGGRHLIRVNKIKALENTPG
jgi:ribose 5-phosphate isomerase B